MSIGVVFPGQGSQQVGMLSDVKDRVPHFATRLEEAAQAISIPLVSLISEGPEDRLNETAVTQPALLAVSVALFEVWRTRRGQDPVAAAGHSLGEYSALTAAGVFEFADAVRLVHERGKAMQSAVDAGEGKMVAVVGLDIRSVEKACDSVDGIVSLANFNSPSQVVIAGTAHAVDSASKLCQVEGAKRVKAIPLPVSVPSHCALMAPTLSRMSELLEKLPMQEPRFPVYHNVDGHASNDIATIRNRLKEQLTAPVRWVDCVQNMIADGVDLLLECGPGNVLAGLGRRIDRHTPVISIGNLANLQQALGVSV